MLELIKSSVREFMDDDCTTMAAALSYYTVFSLPPLLVLILLLVGAVMDPQDVQGSLESNLQSLMGPGRGRPSAPSSSIPAARVPRPHRHRDRRRSAAFSAPPACSASSRPRSTGPGA